MPIEIDGMICEPIEKKEEAAAAEEQLEMSTCPNDPRFQQQNKTKWCYVMYIDFHRCAHYFGPKDKHCQYFQRCYKTLCPIEWYTRWDDQIENGTFPRDLTKEMGR